MKSKFLLLLTIIALFSLTSCQEEVDRNFNISFHFYNNLSDNEDLYVEYENLNPDTVYTDIVKYNDLCGVSAGSYYGNITQKFPPDEYVNHQLRHITIYKKVGDEIQYLPRTYYDDVYDYEVYKDVFFDQHDVMYCLHITSVMFEE